MQVALFFLSANCVYVSLVFPETLQHFCKAEERKKVFTPKKTRQIIIHIAVFGNLTPKSNRALYVRLIR